MCSRPDRSDGRPATCFELHVRPDGLPRAQDLLISGWLEGEDVIAGRAAVVQAAVGSGRVILFGFPVQHRGQSHATFRLLFNALFTAR